MLQSLAMAVLIVALGSTCLAADAPITFPDLFGAWKVERMVGSAPYTEDEKSEKAALGTTIRISADLIKTYDKSDTCKPRNPTITEVDTEAELLEEARTSISGLYLRPGVMKPRLPYLDAGCAAAMVIDHDTLLWFMGNGYIYILKRQHGKVASIGSVRAGTTRHDPQDQSVIPVRRDRELVRRRQGEIRQYLSP